MTASLAEMTREFLDTILPPGTVKDDAYLIVAVFSDPYDDNGRYAHRTNFEESFLWPAQAEAAVAFIQYQATVADVYVCPYLMKERRRRKDGAAWRQIVHSDVDGEVNADMVAELGGFVVWSGTKGHGHVYVLLDYAVTREQHEALCEGLRDYLGADSKVRASDLLRPPGTYNYKPTLKGGPRVPVVMGTSASAVDPAALGIRLGVDLANPGARAATSSGADPEDREQVDLAAWPSINEALAKVTLDRSDDTYGVVAACREAQLSLAQTRWVVDTRDDLRERLVGRADDDVLTCWDRHATLNGWAQPSNGAAPVVAPPAPAPASGVFFTKTGGLLALNLARAVMDGVTCGYGYPDKRFYTYNEGVWTAGEDRIEAEIVRLLGNRYRPTHAQIVAAIIKHQPDIRRIADEPLADYINVVNGMLHWDTGTLVDHHPDFKSTVQLPVEYAPGADCPLFEKFLREVLPSDLVEPTADSPGFIWELLGYTMFSGNPLHMAVLLFGKGRNGKGTLIRVIKALLGENNCSTVSLHELTENKFRAATLFRKLANLAGDLDAKWLENTALFKKITGADGIQGEHKYHDSFEFNPWALPFYSANKAFGSPDSSEGWVARWVVVPFPNTFLGREDRSLDTTLASESELRGILARGAEALPYLMGRGNFARSESLDGAKTEFVLASDSVRAWLDECCVMEVEAWTPRTDLYKAYLRSSQGDGSRHQLGKREFYNRVEQVQGVVATIRQGTRGFGGIQLRPGWISGWE